MIPCGESICEQCAIQIEEKARSSSEPNAMFKCQLCSEVHQIPPNGFPVNKQLSKLLNEKSEKVTRGKLFEALNERLQQLDAGVKESLTQLQLGIDEVSEHCFRLRNKVQLETEQAREFIDTQNERLIGEIDGYERKRREAFQKEGQEAKEAFQKVIDEVKEFHAKWSNYLQQFRVEEVEVNKAIEEIPAKLSGLHASQHIFRRSTFGEKSLEFKSASHPLSNEVLGILEVSGFFFTFV